jgi:hypothetical protein
MMENTQKEALLFNKELIDQLLTHYPEDKHELLLLQIQSIGDFFDKYKIDYVENSGFRKAVDLMISEILSGAFVGFFPNLQQKEESEG